MNTKKLCLFSSTFLALSVASCGKTPTYTVTWDVEGVLTTETYKKGVLPEYKGETPTKVSDNTYTYTFSGWDKEIVPVAEDVTYTALFDNEYIPYTVTWVVDGTSETEIYHYGDTPTYKNGTPTKVSDNTYTYSFSGWDKEVVNVTESTTYTAQFDSEYIDYVVTWVVDGVTTDENYHYGDTPSFKGDTSKDADAQYTYTFSGWDKELTSVTENVTYTAQYDQSVNQYLVTWVVDGNESQESYDYGETPSYKGETSKASTDQYDYEFTGWDKEITTVTGAVTYVATYSETVRKYNITWNYGDGQSVTVPVEYGKTPVAPEDVEKASNAQYSYTFTGWDKTVSPVTGNETYTAQYASVVNEYKVTFLDKDGNLIEEKSVKYGESPVAPEAPVIEDVTFTGWRNGPKTYLANELPTVGGEVSYVAEYKVLASVTLVDVYGVKLGEESYFYDIDEQYTLEAPEVEGYLPGSDYVKGVATKNFSTVLTYSQLSVWGGASDISEELQVIDNNYYIYNASDFYLFATMVNNGETFSGKNIYLRKSIQINKDFPKIGTADSSFLGSFTGLNCSIRGIEINSTATRSALFYGVGTGGVISALNLYGSATVGQYGAALVGRVYGGYVSNINSYVTISHGSGNGAGAIAGGLVSKGNIYNCTNYGNVTSTATGNNKTSGILGMAETGDNRVQNCSNFGAISGNTLTGGIVGEFASNTSSHAGVYNCSNFGNITCTSTTTSTNIGGVVGSLSNSANLASIYNCVNYGNVLGSKTNNGGIGGIVGQYVSTAESSILSKCVNYGTITGNNRTGGIAGHLYNAASECVNYGDVIAGITGSSVADRGRWVGGIAGVAYTGSLLYSCVNYGSISSSSLFAGGILGCVSGSTTINYCENYGTVTVKSNGAGGITGGTLNASSSFTIIECVNNGDVIGNNKIGGIAGTAWSEESTITDSVNNGKLTALATTGVIYLGDLIGQNAAQYAEENAA